jgi:hypothetical protein
VGHGEAGLSGSVLVALGRFCGGPDRMARS